MSDRRMLERVAIAISGAPFPSAASMRKARAALAAMREPSPAMIEAGRWPAEDDGALASWQAMIDIAIAEGEQKP